VFIESGELSKEVLVGNVGLFSKDSLRINILASDKESVFTLLEAGFSIADLDSHVSVAAILEIDSLTQIVVLCCGMFVIPVQVSVLSTEFGI